LVLITSHGVLPKNCDQANFCMDITLLIPSRSWWDYKGHFQLALTGYTLNIRMIDEEMTQLWHLKVCRVSYSSVSYVRDQRVVLPAKKITAKGPPAKCLTSKANGKLHCFYAINLLLVWEFCLGRILYNTPSVIHQIFVSIQIIFCLTQPKSLPNSEFWLVSRRNRRKNPKKPHWRLAFWYLILLP